MATPEQTEPHWFGPQLVYAFKRIAVGDDRPLRVVYNVSVVPAWIVARAQAEGQAVKMHYDEKVDVLYLTLEGSGVLELDLLQPRVPWAEFKQLRCEVA